MSASNLGVVVDHVSDLSSAMETIFFLSFLFLETDLFLEVGILDDLVQSRRYPRVRHLKVREMSITLNWSRWSKIIHRIEHLHFFAPKHNLRGTTGIGTYLGFESHLPTWKRWRCGELCRNQDLKPAVVADEPCNSVDILLLLERENSWLTWCSVSILLFFSC